MWAVTGFMAGEGNVLGVTGDWAGLQFQADLFIYLCSTVLLSDSWLFCSDFLLNNNTPFLTSYPKLPCVLETVLLFHLGVAAIWGGMKWCLPVCRSLKQIWNLPVIPQVLHFPAGIFIFPSLSSRADLRKTAASGVCCHWLFCSTAERQ